MNRKINPLWIILSIVGFVAAVVAIVLVIKNRFSDVCSNDEVYEDDEDIILVEADEDDFYAADEEDDETYSVSAASLDEDE